MSFKRTYLILLLLFFTQISYAQNSYVPRTHIIYQILPILCKAKIIPCPEEELGGRRLLTKPEVASYLAKLYNLLEDEEFKNSPDYKVIRYYTYKLAPEFKEELKSFGIIVIIPQKVPKLYANFRIWLDAYPNLPYNAHSERLFLYYQPDLGPRYFGKIGLKSEQSRDILGKVDVTYAQIDEGYIGYRSKHLNIKYGRQYVSQAPFGLLVHDNFYPFNETLNLHFRLLSLDFTAISGQATRPATPVFPQHSSLIIGSQPRKTCCQPSEYFQSHRISKRIKDITLSSTFLLYGGDDIHGFGFDLTSSGLNYEYANYYDVLLDKNFQAQIADISFVYQGKRIGFTFANMDKGFSPKFSAVNISSDEIEAGGLPDIIQSNFRGMGISLSSPSLSISLFDGEDKDQNRLPLWARLSISKHIAQNAKLRLEWTQRGRNATSSRLRLELIIFNLEK